jgi:hypothetical protein
MTPAEGIDKFGFRRWYERQLIEGHVYFVTCFLSLMLVATCFEQIDWRGSPLQVLTLMSAIVAGGVLCMFSLRRYNFLVVRAECLGAQSSCTQCQSYGVLKVIGAGTGEERGAGIVLRADNPWLRVRFKECGHEWLIENN